jgi:hypothetical protein
MKIITVYEPNPLLWVDFRVRKPLSFAVEDRLVTDTLERDGKIYALEHVPARVSSETGEAFFSPATVEALQAILSGAKSPVRRIEAPVFELAA